MGEHSASYRGVSSRTGSPLERPSRRRRAASPCRPRIRRPSHIRPQELAWRTARDVGETAPAPARTDGSGAGTRGTRPRVSTSARPSEDDSERTSSARRFVLKQLGKDLLNLGENVKHHSPPSEMAPSRRSSNSSPRVVSWRIHLQVVHEISSCVPASTLLDSARLPRHPEAEFPGGHAGVVRLPPEASRGA